MNTSKSLSFTIFRNHHTLHQFFSSPNKLRAFSIYFLWSALLLICWRCSVENRWAAMIEVNLNPYCFYFPQNNNKWSLYWDQIILYGNWASFLYMSILWTRHKKRHHFFLHNYSKQSYKFLFPFKPYMNPKKLGNKQRYRKPSKFRMFRTVNYNSQQ